MIVIHITPEYRKQCNRNFWLFLSYNDAKNPDLNLHQSSQNKRKLQIELFTHESKLVLSFRFTVLLCARETFAHIKSMVCHKCL